MKKQNKYVKYNKKELEQVIKRLHEMNNKISNHAHNILHDGDKRGADIGGLTIEIDILLGKF